MFNETGSFGIMSHYDIERAAEAVNREERLRIGPSGIVAALRAFSDGYIHTTVMSAVDLEGDFTKPVPRVVDVRKEGRHPFMKRQILSTFIIWQLHKPPRLI